MLSEFKLPITEPVMVFALVLFIILSASLFLKKLNIPSIIGLIVAGMIVGPNGLGLLLRDSSIVLFGTVGLLYIMFLAGLELDIHEFKKNTWRSLVFGILTFCIPFGLGFAICRHLLDFGFTASVLIASMFSTHTLVAYPITSRLGLTNNEAVTITVGGTIITDTAVLLILAAITGSTHGELNEEFWARIGISLTIFALVVLLGFPRMATWFFKNVEDKNVSHYIFVMTLLFLASVLAKLAGVEPIIGAFLAGLALNRLIPDTSVLMNRIAFVGNTLFIPFFLISVGMLVDLRVLFEGPLAIEIAAALTLGTLVGKWLAAYLTQKLFRYSILQRDIILDSAAPMLR